MNTLVLMALAAVLHLLSGKDELITCTNSIAISTTNSGNTELVPAKPGKSIYVCSYTINGHGSVDAQFIFGKGPHCSEGETNLTGAYHLTENSGIRTTTAFWQGMKSDVDNALCIELSGGVQVSGAIGYTYK